MDKTWDTLYRTQRAHYLAQYPERLASSWAHRDATRAVGPRDNGYRADPIDWHQIATEARGIILAALPYLRIS